MGDEEKSITEVTRREVVDRLLAATNGNWAGHLQEAEFLSRLYDLDRLPSFDNRFKTAAGDIWKHRVDNPNDWDDHWVFHDRRFKILRAPDEEFLRFLCETVHPMARPDSEAARRLVAEFNEDLARDGWEIYERKQMSGRPVFAARRVGTRVEIFEEPTGWQVDRQMDEARSQLLEASTEEQFQAVGLLCRETLISLAQAVYDPERHPTLDGVAASDTDAKRMLEAFIAVELGGAANEEARTHAKAALRLALALQHDRTADFRTAALCAEATASVVNLTGVLSGARTPRAR
jgi:hypothetical protein